MAAELRFAAMGTDAHVVVVGDAGLLEVARARIDDLEARWSRFRPTSEVSRLNAAAGVPVTVSADTVTLVEHAVAAWRRSAGFVDCTLLGEVIAAGYDRSFGEVPRVRTRSAPTSPGRVPRCLLGPADIRVSGAVITLPTGVGFDPGGIGKGLAADIVSEELMAAGAEGVCVNLGGDLRVRGEPPGPDAWTVALEHPRQRAPIALAGLAAGAVATSTILRRRWLVGGEERHHLIDPRTGAPSASDLALVSVVAGVAWEAETLAKAILLRGGPHPFDLIDGTGADALAVDRAGVITASDGLGAYLGDQVFPHRIVDDLEEVAS